MAAGAEIDISGLQEAIKKAEKSITNLATTTKTQTDSIVASFKNLSDGGLDVFIQKLNQANEALSKIGNNTQGKGLKQVGTDAATSMDSVVKLIDTLNKLYEEQNKGSRKKRSDSSEAQVAQVNKLYRERIDAFRKLSEIMKAGAKGQDIGSDYISSLRGQIMHTESAIQKIRERGNVSKATLNAISQREMEYMMLLEKEGQKVKELFAISDKAKKDAAQYAANTTYKGSLKYSNNVQTLEDERKAIEYLEKAKLKLKNTDADYANKLENINQAIRKHEENLKKAGRTAQENAEIEAKAAKKKADAELRSRISASPDAALKYSREAKSINDQIKAIQNLKQVRDNLDKSSLSSTEYENQVKRINNEIKRQQTEIDKLQGKTSKSFGSMNRYAMQLRNALMMVFSVSQIKNYITQLVKIRAEFEMQQRSLEVLLQSKDEANKLWSQTVQLAVKSPFTVKELVTYTKQLAAYRIESEKLYETNKMLADVSAGLGVDMRRLILAFGQVKAANYLRGTELRQFSEAGVNMLGELSKYFTELEGRAISVGEVFEMISKRRVDFGDVEEVFKRITSEGGLFYKMQEKQSETTLGQWRNLIDSLHLMFNEIGKANDGPIKEFIQYLRDMVNNWQEIIHTIKTFLWVFSPLLAYFASTKILASALGLKMATLVNTMFSGTRAMRIWNGWMYKVDEMMKSTAVSTRILGVALKGLSTILKGVATGAVYWLLFELISKFAEWVSSIGEARREMNRLKDSVAQVTVETQKDLNESIGQYRRLATTLTDVTKSYKEREEAMKSMKRIFADILPDEMLEIENIRKMGSAYKEATDALKLHYATAAEERKKALVDEKIETKLQDEITELIENFKKESLTRLYSLDSEGISSVFGQVVQDAKDGFVSIDNLYSEFLKRLETYYNVEFPQHFESLYFGDNVGEVQKLLRQREELLNMSVGTQFATKEEKEQFEAAQKKKKAYEKEKESLDKLSAAYSTYYGLIKKGIKDEKTLNSAQKDVYNAYKELNIELPTEVAFKEITKDALSIKDEVSRVGIFVANKFAKGLEYGAANNSFLKNFVEETIGKDIKEFKGTEWTKAVEDLMRKTAEEFKLDVSIFDKLMVGTETNISDYIKKIESELQLMENAVTAFDVATKGKGPLSTEQLEAQAKLQVTTLAQIKAYRKIIDALKTYGKEFGLDEKDKKGGGGQGKDWYLELARGVREYHKDVLKNNKTMDIASAKTLAWQQNMAVLKSALKGVGLTIDWLNKQEIDFSKEDGVIGLLNTIKSLPKITAEQRIEIEKIISNIEGEAKINISIGEVESAERELENMFSNYEMTMELKSEGLDSDYFLKLFGLNTVSADEIQEYINGKLGGLKLTGDLNNNELIKHISENKATIGEGYADLYIKTLENLNDKERKLLQERVKNNMKYAKQALTTIGQIRLSEIQEINAINNLYNAEIERAKGNPERIGQLNADKERALKGVKDKSEQDVNKALWEEFKGSEGFIRIFQDAEYASNRAINNMLSELEKLKGGMSDMNVDEIKAIADAMEKLENIKMERFPMVEMFKAMGDLRQQKLGLDNISTDTVGDVEGINAGSITNRKQLRKAIEKYDKAIANERVKQKIITDEGALKASDATIESLIKQKEKLEEVEEQGKNAYARLKEGFGKFGGKINEIGNSLSVFQGSLENMGVNFSDGMKDALGTAQEVLGGIGTMAQGIASGNYLQALMGLFQTLGALFQIGDKKKERQIQDNIKAVEKLGKAYEKLEKKIDEAYSIKTLQSATNGAISNLEEQIRIQEETIALEKDKKKSDEDKIAEYEEQLAQQQEQLEELKKEVISKATAGAFDDVLSVADEFVDAWLEAFKETGDGLSGLEDNFNEFMLNIIKRQASLQIVGAYADKWKQQLEKYVNANDTKLTTDEALKFAESVKADMPELSEALKAYFEAMKSAVDIDGQGDTMSGLQRGVSEITEETAGIIAALLESIRFGVFDRNTKLEQFLNSYNANLNTALLPIETHLKNIDTNTTAIMGAVNSIKNLLDAVATSSGSTRLKISM